MPAHPTPAIDADPPIGVFSLDDDLILRHAPNGGWTISTASGIPGERNSLVGAYSSSEDMIAALASCLAPPTD